MLALMMLGAGFAHRWPVAGGAGNMGPGALQAVQRNAIGRRVEGRGHEGFHAVRNRIHAGGRGQLAVAGPG
jgi:hypothetical protein